MKNIRYLKSRIYSFEIKCSAIISEGLLEGKGKQPILRDLKKELVLFISTVRLTPTEINELWQLCVYLYNSMSKKVRGNRTDNSRVYESMRKFIPFLEKIKNEIGKSIEIRDKKKYLDNLTDKGIFYLCSSHTDCAKDHLDYQGKMYVSTDWRNRCPDEATKNRVRAYIRNHKCKTIEEIVGAPVYMTTRPNCRHYFIRMEVEEVMHNSINKLLREHKMIKNTVSSYEYNMYRMYYERLRALLALRDICPCLELEKDISKTRRIMKKWLSMINR